MARQGIAAGTFGPLYLNETGSQQAITAGPLYVNETQQAVGWFGPSPLPRAAIAAAIVLATTFGGFVAPQPAAAAPTIGDLSASPAFAAYSQVQEQFSSSCPFAAAAATPLVSAAWEAPPLRKATQFEFSRFSPRSIVSTTPQGGYRFQDVSIRPPPRLSAPHFPALHPITAAVATPWVGSSSPIIVSYGTVLETSGWSAAVGGSTPAPSVFGYRYTTDIVPRVPRAPIVDQPFVYFTPPPIGSSASFDAMVLSAVPIGDAGDWAPRVPTTIAPKWFGAYADAPLRARRTPIQDQPFVYAPPAPVVNAGWASELPIPAKLRPIAQRFADLMPLAPKLTTWGWSSASPERFLKPTAVQPLSLFVPQVFVTVAPPTAFWFGASPERFKFPLSASQQQFAAFAPDGRIVSSTPWGWTAESPLPRRPLVPAPRLSDFLQRVTVSVPQGWRGQDTPLFARPMRSSDFSARAEVPATVVIFPAFQLSPELRSRANPQPFFGSVMAGTIAPPPLPPPGLFAALDFKIIRPIFIPDFFAFEGPYGTYGRAAYARTVVTAWKPKTTIVAMTAKTKVI